MQIVEGIPEYLYHYTSLKSAKLILMNKTLRLTSLECMDDKTEAITGEGRNLGKFIFSSCWSENRDSIPQWSMYGDSSRGVCIKLRSFPFKNNYDDYVTEISEYLKENGYDYYDFNLCKPEYLNLNESDYIDDNHLNKLGADKVTNLICKIINEQVDIEDIFELSYNVKISKQVPKVYGVQVFTTTNEENTIYEIAPVANAEEEFYYTINDSGANGEVKLIQEMDTNNIFIIPNSEKGVILIDVWVNGEITNSVKVPYGE